jgi:hypothetical protein
MYFYGILWRLAIEEIYVFQILDCTISLTLHAYTLLLL